MTTTLRPPLAVFLLVGILAGTAEAGQEKAKYHFDEGVQLYKKDDFAGALAEFMKAYDTSPHHSVLYNIAKCQMELQDYLEALTNFEKYLGEGGDSIPEDRRVEVYEKITELQSLLSKVHLEMELEGATIIVDGEEVGQTPRDGPLFLDAGTHEIAIEKEGFVPYRKEFILSRGESATFSVELEPAEAEPDEPDEPVEPDEPDEPVVPEKPSRKKLGPAAFGVTMGLGGALLVSAIGTFTKLLFVRHDYDQCYLVDTDCWKPAEDKMKRFALATDILWISGAALTVTALVLIAFTDFKKERRDVALSPILGPDVAGLTLEGRF